MAGAIGTEGLVGYTTRICRSVASFASLVKRRPMQSNPVCVFMAVGLNTLGNLNFGHQLGCASFHRDGVAQVALQPDCLVGGRQVLAVMAAETARRFQMRQVIRLHSPVSFLVNEEVLIECLLNSGYSRLNFVSVGFIEIGMLFLIKGTQGTNRLIPIIGGGVICAKYLNTFPLDARYIR